MTLTALLALTATACGAGEEPTGDETSDSTPLDVQLKTMLVEDLGPGSRGEVVKLVHRFLTAAGYFPNASLALRYPSWRPAVPEEPNDPALFDERTAAAVRALQAASRLPQTGIVDERTRAILSMPRCGVPDGLPSFDPSDKFAYSVPSAPRKWTFPLTWKLVNSTCTGTTTANKCASGVSLQQAHDVILGALGQWASVVGARRITFSEASQSAAANIQVRFSSNFGNFPGQTEVCPPAPPKTTCLVDINSKEKWFVDMPPPPLPCTMGTNCPLDVRNTILHELGHALGLGHSGISFMAINDPTDGTDDGNDGFRETAVDWAMMTSGQLRSVRQRNLGIDDLVAIRALYGQYKFMNRCGNSSCSPQASDIGVGGGSGGTPVRTWSWFEHAWIVGGPIRADNQYQVFKWVQPAGQPGDWVADNAGAGLAIAVEPSGNPWVISVSNQIWRKDSNSPSTGGWIRNQFGLGTDIGVGRDGSVWIIGLDGRAWKKDAADGWNPVPNRAGFIRIAVNDQGIPVVRDSVGAIYQLSNSDPFTGVWIHPNGVAVDIGVLETNKFSPTGFFPPIVPSPNDTYIVSINAAPGGFGTWVRDFQKPAFETPAMDTWVPLDGAPGAVRVSVGPLARPWLVMDDGNVIRQE